MAKSDNKNTQAKVLSRKELKEQKKQLKEQTKRDKLKNKPKKEKKPGLFKKLKEAWSELRKVTWPTFASVVKKTGVVILVVLIFTFVLFGIDYVLGLIYNLFMS